VECRLRSKTERGRRLEVALHDIAAAEESGEGSGKFSVRLGRKAVARLSHSAHGSFLRFTAHSKLIGNDSLGRFRLSDRPMGGVPSVRFAPIAAE